MPTTQLIGGATGAAAAGAGQRPGLRARGHPEGGLAHGLWLFGAFVPLAVVGAAGGVAAGAD